MNPWKIAKKLLTETFLKELRRKCNVCNHKTGDWCTRSSAFHLAQTDIECKEWKPKK